MNNLPVELVDKVFEYLPLKEVIMLNKLNDQSNEAALRQLKKRCTNISLSAFHPLRDSSLRHIFEQIGPIVRRINVDLILDKYWVPSIIELCPNLEILKYIFRVDHICHQDLISLKTLSFVQVECSEDTISQFLHNKYRNLEHLSIDGTEFNGRCLSEAPTKLRRLNFTSCKLRFHYVAGYLKSNRNLEDLCLLMEEDSVDMSVLVDNIPHVQSLGLIGKQIVSDGYDQLARLPNLIKLDIQLTSANFYKYSEAIDTTHQLRDLNLTFDDFVVTYKFAESFEKFTNLTWLSICIGETVANSKLLLRYLNYLGKYGKLETLVLAGYTSYLELDENNSELRHIKNLRVCNPRTCKCSDHFAIYDNE